MVDPMSGQAQNQIGDLFAKFENSDRSVSVQEVDENKRSKRPRISTEGDTKAIDFALTSSSDLKTPIDASNDVLVLGISWEKFNDDPETLAAMKGYCTFISRNYPLTDIKILIKHKSTESYLVQAAEGFFLFAENLQRARLIARDSGTACHRMRQMPLEFEQGEAELLATSLAKVEDKQAVGGVSPLTTTDGSMDIDSPGN